ncbi:MAG: hypothetical protein H6617_02605 [Bdellovibrionaceae bacterium]|nr:hypothetical protein [Bdellovibrionales bacterium]MCB9253553.1 hypothetical protein [Pseudobdellovibrionaceae bacterium]
MAKRGARATAKRKARIKRSRQQQNPGSKLARRRKLKKKMRNKKHSRG